MKTLENLYLKPITRAINAAVVVDERDAATILQETEEYVFTKGILNGVHTFIHALATKKQGKTGIWVSGYYGSGKSHFIKYLSYCLDVAHREKALQRYTSSVREQKDALADISLSVADEDQRAIRKFDFDKIIFNIDRFSGDKTKENVLVKVLFHQFNKFRGYNDTNIALALFLEKELDKIGKLNDFKQEIVRQLRGEWATNYMRYTNRYLSQVLDIAALFDPNLDKNALSKAVSNQQQDYRIEDFINELTDFLKDKTPQYRLIFFIDEVSQYIGSSTSLLLNLQTVIESIGTSCQNKIWVVCTAQQDISSVIDRTDDKQEDFGKILGRFDTRISLESQDAALITKIRLLDKTEDAKADLKEYYKKHKAAIENQFSGFHDLYKNYAGEADFIETYPFVPYQFRLISDVFSAFSQAKYVGEGVKDNERSIIGITHFTAKLAKDQQMGYFMPFDQFFNDNLRNDLVHYASNLINRAYNIDFKKESPPFSRRVVNALFLVSNISEVLQVQFPANLANISVLLIENLAQSKRDLQSQVNNVLNELIDKKIIQEIDGIYRFFKEEEIEVANMIDSTNVTMSERLEILDRDIISPIFKSGEYKFSFGNNIFRAAVKIDDRDIGGQGKGNFNVLYSIYDDKDIQHVAHKTNENTLVVCINEWFKTNESFRKDFLRYVKTAKYLSVKDSSRKETNERFRRDNAQLMQKMQNHFRTNLAETPFIIAQRVVMPNEINGQNPVTRFEEAVQKLLAEIYRKNQLAGKSALSNADVLKAAQDQQQAVSTGLTAAEIELESKIQLLGVGCNLDDVIKKMEEPPFGWRDMNTIHTLLGLAKKGKRRFEYKHSRFDSHKDFVEKAFNARERSAILIHPEQAISAQDVTAFINAVNNAIFSENLLPAQVVDAKLVAVDFKAKLKGKIDILSKNSDEFEGFPFNIHFKKFKKELDNLAAEREAKNLFDKTIEQTKSLAEQRDFIAQLNEFLENRTPQYKAFHSFVKTHKSNFLVLEDNDRLEAEKLTDYVQNDDKPFEQFAAMLKTFRSLENAIKNLVASLKERTRAAYTSAFVTLETEQQKLNITDANVLPDLDYLLRSIERATNITELELKLRQVSDFRTEGLKSLLNFNQKQQQAAQLAEPDTPQYKAAEIVIFNFRAEADLSTKIENEAELDAYLAVLRKKLLAQLKDNKIIILK